MTLIGIVKEQIDMNYCIHCGRDFYLKCKKGTSICTSCLNKGHRDVDFTFLDCPKCMIPEKGKRKNAC